MRSIEQNNIVFVKTASQDECAEVIAHRITEGLHARKKILWLLSGGSNIPISSKAMRMIRVKVTPELLGCLSLSLTDERYGLAGHVDSNWQQLINAGLNFDSTNPYPVLKGRPLTETLEDYCSDMEDLLHSSDLVIGQFGIGTDKHIAGVLPHTIGVHKKDIAVSYDSPPLIRITLTLNTLQNVNEAYAFVFGTSKKEAVFELKNGTLPLEEAPSNVLRSVQKAYLYSDQL